jgi:endonuclease/exonuclease/phosphatase (EEP) superfamily protein YafD
MRIMTANLWNVNVSADSFAEALDEHRPDVVAIQELAQHSSAVLADRYAYGLAIPDGVQGCALVANHPITVTRTELPFRPLLSAPVEVRGRTVTIGAVHLANPVAMHDVRFRRHQVRALLDEIQGTEPLVLVGDYNSSPAWPAYRMITRHLRDGVNDWAKQTGTRPTRTWNWGAGSPKLLRIDHIMVRGVELTDVKVIDIAGSDHRALVADIA